MVESARWRQRLVVTRFVLLHVAALAVFLVPFTWSLVWWLAGSYLIRMFGVTAGYHRYFSHRSYKLGRGAQFVMAMLAQTSGQKGALWWAAHHRDHHRHSDGPQDVHSPQGGVLVVARRLDPVRPGTTTTTRRGSPTSAATRSCAGSIAITGADRGLRRRRVAHRRLRGVRLGLPPRDGAALSRDLRDQLGGAHLGHAARSPPPTTAATTSGSRSSRWARGGTTTTTTAARAVARGPLVGDRL